MLEQSKIVSILTLFIFFWAVTAKPTQYHNDEHVMHDVAEFYAKINSSIDIAHHQLALIDSRWDMKAHPLIASDFEGNSFAQNIFMVKHILAILNPQSKMTFSFSGSSVTAGRDCLPEESYPRVIEANLHPIYASLGISFQVRNIAISNNPCQPYDACAAQWSGDDVDLFGWEHNMNCGDNSKFGLLSLMYHAIQSNDHPLFIIPFKSRRVVLNDDLPVLMVNRLSDDAYINETNFTSLHLTQDGKCCGHKQWHPSPYGHLLVADKISRGIIFHVILPSLMLIKGLTHSQRKIPSLYDIDNHVDRSLSNATFDYDNTSVHRMECNPNNYSNLQNIGYCEPTLVCHTTSIPTYNHAKCGDKCHLISLVHGLTADLNQISSFTNHYSTSNITIIDGSSWLLRIFADDLGAGKLNLNFTRDLKWVITGDHGSISFIFYSNKAGPIAICQPAPNASQNSLTNDDFLEVRDVFDLTLDREEH